MAKVLEAVSITPVKNGYRTLIQFSEYKFFSISLEKGYTMTDVSELLKVIADQIEIEVFKEK